MRGCMGLALYICRMSLRLRPRPLPLGFVLPCLPSVATKPPTGPNWIHEIKHDGFRILVLRVGERVRVLTRNGVDVDDVDGQRVFEHACSLGFEGIVSKRKGSLYQSGRSHHWVKSKNPDAPPHGAKWKIGRQCHAPLMLHGHAHPIGRRQPPSPAFAVHWFVVPFSQGQHA
jgi:ATP-dependent DNA ligase